MRDRKVRRDPIPEEFSSDEEAGRFWDTHDSTDYLDQMSSVEVDVRLEKRRFEIEVEEDLIEDLRQRAATEHVSASSLANDLLRRGLVRR